MSEDVLEDELVPGQTDKTSVSEGVLERVLASVLENGLESVSEDVLVPGQTDMTL